MSAGHKATWGKRLVLFHPGQREDVKGPLWGKGCLRLHCAHRASICPINSIAITSFQSCIWEFFLWCISCSSSSQQRQNQLNPEANYAPTPQSPGWWCDPVIMHFPISFWDTWETSLCLSNVSEQKIIKTYLKSPWSFYSWRAESNSAKKIPANTFPYQPFNWKRS